MSRHHFHCTDGVSLFADEAGSQVARDDEIFLGAMRRAEAVMGDLPSHDWSGWLVCVYDELNQMVDVVDFPGLRPLIPVERERVVERDTMRDVICAAGPRARPRLAASKARLSGRP